MCKSKIRDENLIITETIPDYFEKNSSAIVIKLSKITFNNSNLQSDGVVLNTLLSRIIQHLIRLLIVSDLSSVHYGLFSLI